MKLGVRVEDKGRRNEKDRYVKIRERQEKMLSKDHLRDY